MYQNLEVIEKAITKQRCIQKLKLIKNEYFQLCLVAPRKHLHERHACSFSSLRHVSKESEHGLNEAPQMGKRENCFYCFIRQ